MVLGMGDRVEGGRLQAAIAAAMGAPGELSSGRDREGHGLGHVE